MTKRVLATGKIFNTYNEAVQTHIRVVELVVAHDEVNDWFKTVQAVPVDVLENAQPNLVSDIMDHIAAASHNAIEERKASLSAQEEQSAALSEMVAEAQKGGLYDLDVVEDEIEETESDDEE